MNPGHYAARLARDEHGRHGRRGRRLGAAARPRRDGHRDARSASAPPRPRASARTSAPWSSRCTPATPPSTASPPPSSRRAASRPRSTRSTGRAASSPSSAAIRRRPLTAESFAPGELELDRCGIAFKRYACCGAIHAALDATLELRERHGLTAADVASARVGVNRWAPDILIHHSASTAVAGPLLRRVLGCRRARRRRRRRRAVRRRPPRRRRRCRTCRAASRSTSTTS